MVTLAEIEAWDMVKFERLGEAAEYAKDVMDDFEELEVRLLVRPAGIMVDIVHHGRMVAIDRIVHWTDIEHNHACPIRMVIDILVNEIISKSETVQ